MPPEPSVTSASLGPWWCTLEVAVGAVTKDLRAPRPEVGQRREALLGRRARRRFEVDGRHGCVLPVELAQAWLMPEPGSIHWRAEPPHVFRPSRRPPSS